MSHRFAEIAFTPTVKKFQTAAGSRTSYARMESVPESIGHRLTAVEAEFLAARDSFYMATVSETGWPYVQHRGGPVGFVRVLDEGRIGFADYRGNRQYVSVGNVAGDDRVALFFMDYPNRRRLKLFGRARAHAIDHDAARALLAGAGKTESAAPHAPVERVIVIAIEAFDWNCPKFIHERYTLEELGRRATETSG